MASSKNVSDLPTIASDFAAWRTGERFSIGFEAVAEESRWDPAFYEPIDFGMGGVAFPYAVVRLGEIASIAAGKTSDAARIAVNRTGSKSVWLADEPDINPRNNIFLAPTEGVNPSYLLRYLNSTVGRRAVGRFIKGTSIPHISAQDLAEVPVVLPELAIQKLSCAGFA